MLVSAVQWRESAICVYVSPRSGFSLPALWVIESTELSPLCYTALPTSELSYTGHYSVCQCYAVSPPHPFLPQLCPPVHLLHLHMQNFLILGALRSKLRIAPVLSDGEVNSNACKTQGTMLESPAGT